MWAAARALARDAPAPVPIHRGREDTVLPRKLREEDARLLELDLHRAGREGLGISDEDAPAHREALRRVLQCWCTLRPEIGYVQGLNCIAAALLVLCDHSEDEAVKLLVLLVDRLPPDWYLDELLGGRVETGALLKLYEARAPALFSAPELPMTLHVVASSWLLSLWVGFLPLDCVGVAWHRLLTEPVASGPPASNLCVALALLGRCEAAVADTLWLRGDEDVDPQSSTYAVVMAAADGLTADELSSLLDSVSVPPEEVARARAAARAELHAEERERADAKAARARAREEEARAREHERRGEPQRARRA